MCSESTNEGKMSFEKFQQLARDNQKRWDSLMDAYATCPAEKESTIIDKLKALNIERQKLLIDLKAA
jgi:cytidylate kinase